MHASKRLAAWFSIPLVLVFAACESETALWERTQQAHTVEAYEAFRTKYPESEHVAVADSAIAALDWALAETTNTVEGFAAFVEKHGMREEAAWARERIEHLEKTALHRAAARGDLERVRALLVDGAAIDATEAADATPLHLAAYECQDDVAALLIERGADVEKRARDDAPPLHWAAQAGCLDVMRRLIAAGAGVDAAVRHRLSGYAVGAGGRTTYFGRTQPAIKGSALHWAVFFDQPEAAALLLEEGADVNQTTGWGRSPLHRAAQNGSVPLTRLLLERGARIRDAELRNGQPIHYAANPAVAELLVAHGARIAETSPYRGTPLHTAAYLGHREVVDYFLQAGLAVDARGTWNMDSGWTDEVTPLWAAAYGGELDVLKLLEARGGDLHFETDALGGSLLHAAAWQGYDDVVAYLLSKDMPADEPAAMPTVFPLTRPWEAATPLAIAAHFGHVGVIERLVEAGADLEAVTDGTWTPLHLAMYGQEPDAVQYLLDQGATLDLEEEALDRWNTTDEIKDLLRAHLRASAAVP